MKDYELRDELRESANRIYGMELFSSLTELVQGENHVLQYLVQHRDDEINPSLLSDHLHVSRSRITAALTGLRKKGYVTMEMSEHDRRRMCVRLTVDGESLIRQKQERIEDYFEALVVGLGEKNVKEFIRLIELSLSIMNARSIEK
ncbi:MarR family winged helix-turn-helix transcriptional regulator [Paenibacillus polymyxa]|uniref:MarR family winged helix-turn-helix transcriptional regulator n=1 Tax=Paenibacillus polymyxa TaxID=1406 RepID=UPI002378E4FC|nr:MarR family transcriptional regulator [Paenibacillus polymyxa]WDM23752.1 MarR family transcriptional regulator [Paenibacillus polymyxa]